MPVIESGLKMTWVARERLKGFPSIKPAEKVKSEPYEIPLPPVGVSQENVTKQPEVLWQPHDERPNDTFGRLWVDRRREEPQDPIV